MSEDNNPLKDLASNVLNKMNKINKPSKKSYIKLRQKVVCHNEKGEEEEHKHVYNYKPYSDEDSK